MSNLGPIEAVGYSGFLMRVVSFAFRLVHVPTPKCYPCIFLPPLRHSRQVRKYFRGLPNASDPKNLLSRIWSSCKAVSWMMDLGQPVLRSVTLMMAV